MIEHKGTGWKLHLAELTQGMAEEFDRLFRADDHSGTSSQDAGRVLRAGIGAGWVLDITVEQMAGMKPACVRWMAKQMDDAYLAAVTIPPE